MKIQERLHHWWHDPNDNISREHFSSRNARVWLRLHTLHNGWALRGIKKRLNTAAYFAGHRDGEDVGHGRGYREAMHNVEDELRLAPTPQELSARRRMQAMTEWERDHPGSDWHDFVRRSPEYQQGWLDKAAQEPEHHCPNELDFTNQEWWTESGMLRQLRENANVEHRIVFTNSQTGYSFGVRRVIKNPEESDHA